MISREHGVNYLNNITRISINKKMLQQNLQKLMMVYNSLFSKIIFILAYEVLSDTEKRRKYD